MRNVWDLMIISFQNVETRGSSPKRILNLNVLVFLRKQLMSFLLLSRLWQTLILYLSF